MAQKALSLVLRAEKNLQKNLKEKNLKICFVYIIFLCTWEALIYFIWICYVKVMDNLVFRAIREPF